MNLVRTFGWVAIAEAISFVLLLGATVIKYGFDEPLGVEILGPLHGGLFLLFVGLALIVAGQLRWSLRRTAIVLLSAVIPIAGYIVGHQILTQASTQEA